MIRNALTIFVYMSTSSSFEISTSFVGGSHLYETKDSPCKRTLNWRVSLLPTNSLSPRSSKIPAQRYTPVRIHEHSRHRHRCHAPMVPFLPSPIRSPLFDPFIPTLLTFSCDCSGRLPAGSLLSASVCTNRTEGRVLRRGFCLSQFLSQISPKADRFWTHTTPTERRVLARKAKDMMRRRGW